MKVPTLRLTLRLIAGARGPATTGFTRGGADEAGLDPACPPHERPPLPTDPTSSTTSSGAACSRTRRTSTPCAPRWTPAGAVLRGLRPDRSEPAHGQPRADPHRAAAPGRRARPLRPGRRRDRADRRPAGLRRADDEPADTVQEWVAQGQQPDRAVPVVRGRQRRDDGEQLRLDRETCRRSTSCATSASTSRSTGCWPARWCGPGSRAASATPSSATCCCSRWTTSSSSATTASRLQFGGSDQWGNLTGGVELIRRVTGEHAHAFATPLVTKADGTKYGKTEGGALWLDPAMLSPYAFYQFWLNVEDVKVGELLRVFTFLDPRGDRGRWSEQTAEKPFLRAGQKALAEEVTTLVHGAEETERIKAASAALFGGGDLRALDRRTLGAALREAGGARGAPGRRAPDDRRPARGRRALGEPGRGPAHGGRGRRLPQQRAGHRPRAPARRPTTCSAASGWCCGAARRTSPASGSSDG